MIPSILPSHNNAKYISTIMVETNPSDCSTQSQTITLRVKTTYINSVTILPTSLFSFINSTVVLTCTISLNTGIGPDTSFISHYWYQYSTDISDRRTQLMINGESKSLVTTLNITSVQLSDAGEYQCRASIDGNDTFINGTAHLCIQVPIMNSSFDINLRLGDIREYDCTLDTLIKEVVTNIDSLILSNTSQQLDCHVTTNTDINTTNTDINSIVNVYWYRDNGNENRLVSGSKGVSILPIVSVTNTSFISTLRFSPITSSTPVSTLGNYTCVAWIGEQSEFIYRMKTNHGTSDLKTNTEPVYDDPDISLKEVKPQAVYDEVKIESTDPVSAADYEVPVTAITEENVDIKMECNEAYATVNTL
uniref:Ig-like domain-containing protein n=1 Tax=Amphimedon queenslandica TaxID=400682 RepID=A0A1X7UNP8_AMPQE